ncbi:MAG TPA: hypothetical protein VGO88_00775 [Mycetocola sp.]|nr:hypothetical protein [Mycetocola sp.]HEV7847847.1 hypothetical protein [Mycetocola sp.]
MTTAPASGRSDDRGYDEFSLDYDPTYAGESSFGPEDFPPS